MAKRKNNPLIILLFSVILLVYLSGIFIFFTSCCRFVDTAANVRFVIGIMLLPLPIILMSFYFREEVAYFISAIVALAGLAGFGYSLMLGLLYFATFDEFCFTEEVLRFPVKQTEIAVTWHVCPDPDYGRVRVQHEWRVFEDMLIVKDVYDREMEELDVKTPDHPPQTVHFRKEGETVLSVRVVPPDRVVIHSGGETETIHLRQYVYF